MTHFYEPRNGHGLPHDPFNAIVGPRPIGWVSTRSNDGALNLAPYSFFTAFNYIPPIIGFSSTGPKDSLRNVQENGMFVWNLVTRPLAEAMNQTCAPVGPEVNEFELAGLKTVPSRVVDVPRVADSPVSFECRSTQIIQLEGLASKKCPRGWCWAKWWVCTLPATCSKTACTTPPMQATFCVAAAQRITSRLGQSSCSKCRGLRPDAATAAHAWAAQKKPLQPCNAAQTPLARVR